ncbi:MAG: hypothetical protein RhofKO_40480 [Rhodothermales bacterium]
MKPVLSVLGVLLLVLILGSALLWRLAYHTTAGLPPLPESAPVTTPTTLTWLDPEGIVIETDSETDAVLALGYAQAAQDPWLLFLLRQAALSELSTWFGAHTDSLDVLTTLLGFREAGEVDYGRLPDTTRHYLGQYAEGINLAIDTGDLRLREASLLIDRDVSEWQPWHTLSVGRLLYWLAATPRLDSTTVEMEALYHLDQQLRDGLTLHSWGRVFVAQRRDSAQAFTAHRYVMGNGIEPPLRPVYLRIADGPEALAWMLPGLPSPVAYHTEALSWLTVPQSSANWTLSQDTTFVPQFAQRFYSDGGFDDLAVLRTDEQLAVSPAADSTGTGTLTWSGLSATLDWASRLTLQTAPPPPFVTSYAHLQYESASPLRVSQGTLPVRTTSSFSWFTSDSLDTYLSAHIDNLLLAPEVNAEALLNDTYSRAAALTLDTLRAYLALAPQSGAHEEAKKYLLNWDAQYQEESIAPVVFEWWQRARAQSPLPDSLRTDSLLALTAINTFGYTVSALLDSLGPDLSTWRWGDLTQVERFSPGYLFLHDHRYFSTRYQGPQSISGYGHASTLTTDAHSAQQWWRHSDELSINQQLPRQRPHQFLGAYLQSEDRPDFRAITP